MVLEHALSHLPQGQARLEPGQVKDKHGVLRRGRLPGFDGGHARIDAAGFGEPGRSFVCLTTVVCAGFSKFVQQSVQGLAHALVQVSFLLEAGAIQVLGANPGQRAPFGLRELRAIEQRWKEQFIIEPLQRRRAEEGFVALR